MTYQSADENSALAVSKARWTSWDLLASTLSALDSLLDSTNGSSDDGLSGTRATSASTGSATTSSSLSRDDLVKRLVELSRHVCGVYVLNVSVKVNSWLIIGSLGSAVLGRADIDRKSIKFRAMEREAG